MTVKYLRHFYCTKSCVNYWMLHTGNEKRLLCTFWRKIFIEVTEGSSTDINTAHTQKCQQGLATPNSHWDNHDNHKANLRCKENWKFSSSLFLMYNLLQCFKLTLILGKANKNKQVVLINALLHCNAFLSN